MGDVVEEEQLKWINELLQRTIDGNIMRLDIMLQDKVRALPAYVGFVRSVRILRILDNTSLTQLPATFGELSENLRHLELQRNALEALPDEFGSLVSLEYLDLSHNRLRTLPFGIGQLKKLAHLDVSHNKMKYYPCDLLDLNPVFRCEPNPHLHPTEQLKLEVPQNVPRCSQCSGPMPYDIAGNLTGLCYMAFQPFGGLKRLPFMYNVCGTGCLKACHRNLFVQSAKEQLAKLEAEKEAQEQTSPPL
eukprot:EG_transcript_23013